MIHFRTVLAMPDPKAPRAYRELLTLVVAGLGIVGYSYLTNGAPLEDLPGRIPLLAGLDGDLPSYVWRFALCFLLLGVLPLGTALATGESLGGLGLRAPRRIGPRWVWLPVAVACLASAGISAYDREIAAFYPYARTLLDYVRAGRVGVFGVHAALYVLLYYLPWEIVFRGLLIFPILRVSRAQDPPALLFLSSLQALPSALLHFGHPVLESLGAVPFGVVMGWLAYRTGSILPGLAIHAGIGVLLDLLLALRYVGALP